jgi:hypothetical protein
MQAILINELSRVIAELANHGRVDNFYSSLAQAYVKYGSLTERQEAALKRSLTNYHDRNERIVASRAARVVTQPIPTGRVVITGKVISTKWQASQYGDTFKMLVESEQGWRVFGTVPSRLSNRELTNGTKVVFTAEVQPKEADFGFFSRPTGGAVLTDEQPVPINTAEALDREFSYIAGERDDKPVHLPPLPLTGLAALVAAAGYTE